MNTNLATLLVSSDSVCTKQNRLNEKLGFGLIWLSSVVVLALLCLILVYIFIKGAGQAFSWDYLFTPPEGGRNDNGGILYPLIGTIYLIEGALLVSAPIGIFAAIYLNEYANPKALITQWSRFAIDSLAGIPSIIYGLFGLAFFVTFLNFKHSILAASLSVAIMILPVIIRTTEEALKSVPRSFRDASYALGANKVQTIFQTVLPSALPSIFTGIMLSIGRAVAESAIIILAAGGSITSMPMFASSNFPFVFPDSGRTLAVHLYYQAISFDNVERAFATALILVLIVLSINMLAMLGLSFGKKLKLKQGIAFTLIALVVLNIPVIYGLLQYS